MYRFKNIGWIYYKFCQSKKARDFIYSQAIIKIINLGPNSIINNIILTIISKYKTMKRNYLLLQNRSVLESKLLKHIHDKNFSDKFIKYNYLSKKYELFNIK